MRPELDVDWTLCPEDCQPDHRLKDVRNKMIQSPPIPEKLKEKTLNEKLSILKNGAPDDFEASDMAKFLVATCTNDEIALPVQSQHAKIVNGVNMPAKSVLISSIRLFCRI